MKYGDSVAGQTDVTERVVRQSELKKITGISPQTAYRLGKIGLFPLPKRLSARSKGWLMSELQEWIKKRKVSTIELSIPIGKRGRKKKIKCC